MVIHEDRYMDFFYMADLISLVDCFLSKEEWLSKEVDCVYMEKRKLTDVAQIINQLGKYRVMSEPSQSSLGTSYTGLWRGLPIKLIGLEQGIKNVYNSLR